jgi:ABC-type phosphate transport system substrate-binding protein
MKVFLTGVITFFVLTCAGLAAAPAGAETMAVVVNKNNPIASLSVAQIRRIYQDEMVRWPGGDKIEVYDLPVDNPGRAQFSRRVIGKAADRVAADWANKKITNTAKNPPKIVKSKVLMLYKVSKSKSAIGYLPLAMAKGKAMVKVMATID